MSPLKILKALLSIYYLIENFLKFQKKQEIIDKKNEALKTGDQRELEKVLSQDNKPVDNSVNNDKYNGLYERPIKKKS